MKTYCGSWGLKVNTENSKIIVLRKREPSLDTEKWTYDDMPVNTVNNLNYLGTVFNYTCNFALNQETLTGKILKALIGKILKALIGKILKALYTLLANTCFLFCYLMHSLALLIIMHVKCGALVNQNPIERIHLKRCKLILKVE